MSKESTKAVLLETGKKFFLENGYNHSGIESILQAAGVPKGSFYYYFANKEDFGLQVLNQFAEGIGANFERHQADTTLSPLGRLRSYFEEVCTRLAKQQCRHGCLVGNLSQEMADQSEPFRARLEEIFEGWRDRYAECLKEAQDAGEISPALDVRELAEFCLSGWQGAILRAKVARNIGPLRIFIDLLFGYVLRAREEAPLVSQASK
jgi:TetR/AcrR family transcriptional regulator, transcriptional repressor for nem operon